MKIFLIKCFVVTVCLVCVVKSIPIQKYEFLDKETRGNKCTGRVEHKTTYGAYWD